MKLNSKYLLLFVSMFVLAACNKHFQVSQINYAERRMTDSLMAFDPVLEKTIAPYRDSMNVEMKQVVAISDAILTKQKPESDLGNLLADILLAKTAQYTHKKVDVAVINFGGIRISQLPAGKITRENIFELMPFDNKIVLLNIKGNILLSLFNKMAASGGVPIAGARYKIADTQAADVFIQGAPIDTNAQYNLAISDYLANGGDNLDVLKPLPQIQTGMLLRDAFLEGFAEINAKGEHVKSIKDGRISILNTKQ